MLTRPTYYFGCVARIYKSLTHQITRYSTKMVNDSSTVPLDNEANRIAWIDLEMTGLDINTCHILEIACLVTDSNLNIIAEGPDIIIHQPATLLDNMNAWCVKQHGETGLTEASKTSKIHVEDAEQIVLDFLTQHIQPGTVPLAGNSVYTDRLFLNKYMPRIDKYLHYRILDVSTIKELCKRWNPEVYKQTPKKIFEHRALNDIRESVEELKWYKAHFLKCTQ